MEGGLLSHLAQGRNAPRKAREVTLQRSAPSTFSAQLHPTPEHPNEDPGYMFSDYVVI